MVCSKCLSRNPAGRGSPKAERARRERKRYQPKMGGQNGRPFLFSRFATTPTSPEQAPSTHSWHMLCGNPDTPSPQIGRYTSGRQLAFEKYRRAGRIGRTSKTLRLVVLSCSKDKQTLRGAAILPGGIELAPGLGLPSNSSR